MPESTRISNQYVVEASFRAKDKVKLFMRRVKASQSPKARLAIVHGYAEHCDRYGFVTQYFSSKGYDCWTFDLRGHGESEGARGFVTRFDDYLLDLSALFEEMQQEDPETPLFLVAHSMGALVAVRWLQTRLEQARKLPLAGVVLSSPFFALKLKVAGVKRFAANMLSGILPSFTLPNELKATDLTRDEEVQKIWLKDEKLVKKVPARWFTEALNAQESLFQHLGVLEHAVLLHHGAADPVADPEASKRFIDELSLADKSSKFWEGLRHEIFNEIEREQVFSEIEAWLEAHLPEKK